MILPDIPTQIGLPFSQLAHFDPNNGLKPEGDQYPFTQVTMGGIPGCNLIVQVQQDTIVSITILLQDEKSRKLAIELANRQFGQGQFSKNEMMSVHGWIYTTPRGNISISIAFTEREPVSEMYIKAIRN